LLFDKLDNERQRFPLLAWTDTVRAINTRGGAVGAVALGMHCAKTCAFLVMKHFENKEFKL